MFAINSRDTKIIPALISIFTWGKTYHVELRFSDGVSLTTEPQTGVQYVTRQYDFYHWVAIPLLWIDHSQEEIIRKWADTLVQSHTKYDYLGAILGGTLGSNDPNKYFCSELTAEALSTCMPILDKNKWYSPNDLWKILSEYLSTNYPRHIEIALL